MTVFAAAWLACRPATDSPVDTVEPEPTAETATPTSDGPLSFRGRPPRNLLMISIDTLRRDAFGDYGEAVYTDFFAALLQDSVRLDDHQQCSNWTYASTSCTLLGRYHEENGFIPALRSARVPFPDGQNTLASRLHEHGYWSMLLSRNSWLGPEYNNAQGYDDVREPSGGGASGVFESGRARVAEAKAAGHDRWFLHLHLMEPHATYVPPPEYYAEELEGVPPLPAGWDLSTDEGHYGLVNNREQLTPAEQDLLEKHLRARYHGELAFLDDQVEEQWSLLAQAGMLDDTLVVVWNDHGEQFFERGHQSHAWNLNAEENDGFLFFWAYNLVPARWTEPTASVDLVPTVLDALGFSANDPELSGFVLGTAPVDRPRYAMSVAREGVVQSVTQGDRKLIFDWNDARVTSFDRGTDRAERTDRFDPSDPVDRALWDQLLPRVLRMDSLQPDETLVWPAELPHP
jgi:arylsulfatase A-like enzyme